MEYLSRQKASTDSSNSNTSNDCCPNSACSCDTAQIKLANIQSSVEKQQKEFKIDVNNHMKAIAGKIIVIQSVRNDVNKKISNCFFVTSQVETICSN